MYTTRRNLTKATWLSFLLYALTVFMPVPVQAYDTDLFTTSSNTIAPNVLIVLDNRAQFSNNSQKFLDANGSVIIQGQAEVQAIKSVIKNLGGYINVGLMEYPKDGSGGYIRFAVSPMGSSQTNGAANQTAFSTVLDYIYNNITDNNGKTNDSTPLGPLFNDAYNYFAGLAPIATATDSGVVAYADKNGYVNAPPFTLFHSPITSSTSCGNNYIIFVSNTTQNGPTADATSEINNLTGLGGNGSQLKLQNYSSSTIPVNTNLGYSNACYASAPSAITSEFTATCANYDSCAYSTSGSTSALPACSSGQSRYLVQSTGGGSTVHNYQFVETQTDTATKKVAVTSSTTTGTAITPAPTSPSNSCYSKVGNGSGQWNSGTGDYGTLTCPSNTSSTSGNVTTYTTYACTYSGVLSSTTCSGGGSKVTVTQSAVPSSYTITTTTTTSTSTSTGASSCYSSSSNFSNTDHGNLTCPSTTTSTVGSSTTTTTHSCTYSVSSTVATGSSCADTTTGGTTSTIGNSFNCYASAPASGSAVATADLPVSGCPSGTSCSYGSATTNNSCPTGSSRFQAVGTINTLTELPLGTFTTDTATYNADEWARFLDAAVTVKGAVKPAAATFTIDVYHNHPNGVTSSLLSSMASNGGGAYYVATNASQFTAALSEAFSQIQATNSTFASAALPISATNRTQNDNQVYIGMFRPDQQSFPRWFGNLKRYQFGSLNGVTTLVDATAKTSAVNNTSGFINDCAQSYWTTNSGNYWANVTGTVPNQVVTSPSIFFTTESSPGTTWITQGNDTNLVRGQCANTALFSDLPDGGIVEKGGAAEVLRNSTSRTIKTYSGGSVVNFSSLLNTTTLSTNTTINNNIVNFISGQDVTGEINSTASTANRPSIHGDVIHSKPLAIDFGGTTGVNVYYGANDGTYRSVNATTGMENWAFVAPEFNSTLQRLMDNNPVVASPYPTPSGQTAAAGTHKDFFFDGSTGLYQNSDNSKVWIYPAMRRGGRMLYSFDVSPGSSAATVKWKAGCPNQSNDTGCADGAGNSAMSGIGQTWSTPNVAFLNGYSTSTPVVIVGGGYDTCEDADTNPATTTSFCTTPKGAAVYVLDGNTGAVIRTFSTDRSVAGDVALVDVNLDGTVDLAYVADTGGNIYRINFSDPSNGFAALSSSSWTITKVAYTSGSGRKFLFAPSVLPYKNEVYVAIGSGDREHPLALSYPFTTPIVNRFYVYLDDPTQSTLNNLDSSTVSYNFTPGSSDVSSNTCNSPKVLPGGTKKAWFMSLNQNGTGEQTVTSSLILGGLVSFSTNRPITGAACSQDLGEARGYTVNLLNGAGAIGVDGTCGGVLSSVFVGGGLSPSPVAGVVTINVNGVNVTQTVEIGVAQKDGSTSTPISPQQVLPPATPTIQRLYWRTPTDTH